MELTFTTGLIIAAVSFAAEYVDSSLGMGYGTTLTPVLLLIGAVSGILGVILALAQGLDHPLAAVGVAVGSLHRPSSRPSSASTQARRAARRLSSA